MEALSRVRDRRSERGGAMAILAVSVSTLLLFTLGAISIDLGAMYKTRRAAQTAADMAALAGGPLLKSDPLAACMAALEYLRSNNPFPNDDVSPIPDDSACTASGTTTNPVDTDGDGTADTAVVTITAGLQSNIRVVLPRQRVPFGFARALGVSESSVTAGATVSLRSTGALVPVGVPVGCMPNGASGDWYFDVTAKPPNSNDTACDGANTGNFGFLRFDGGSGASDTSEQIRSGKHQLDAIPATTSDLSAPPADPACPATSGSEGGSGTIGTTSYTANWDNGNAAAVTPSQPVPNCVSIESGFMSQTLEDGLIESSNGACDGRLVSDGNLPTARKVDCFLDDSRFAEFWLGSEGAIRAGTPDTISGTILNSKNFMVLPVLYSAERPPSGGGNGDGWIPVVGLTGFFIDCPPSTPAGRASCPNPFGSTPHSIDALRGYVFDLDTIQVGVNNGASVKDFYTGGPAIPVLVRDPLN